MFVIRGSHSGSVEVSVLLECYLSVSRIRIRNYTEHLALPLISLFILRNYIHLDNVHPFSVDQSLPTRIAPTFIKRQYYGNLGGGQNKE